MEDLSKYRSDKAVIEQLIGRVQKLENDNKT